MSDLPDLPDLASRTFGGGVVAANDEFFAAADNLVDPRPPTFQPSTFAAKGQVYDGWETRRRRDPGADHAIVRLGLPGVVRLLVIDTSFFTGNYPPYAAVDGCAVDGHPGPVELARARWVPLLARTPLAGDSRNAFPVAVPYHLTHVRLTIFPDGGVARLRVYGDVVPDPALLPEVFDLAAAEHGGWVEACSDRFYGAPQNLLAPGPARTMGEGWETARRRDDGNDWVLVRLGLPGTVHFVDLDTSHFKGNAPGSATLRAADARHGDLDDPRTWFPLLPDTRLRPDTRHRFPVTEPRTATHVRLDVFPDGGMARLRVTGRADPTARAVLAALRERTRLPAAGPAPAAPRGAGAADLAPNRPHRDSTRSTDVSDPA
ncbi:allantoicase [Micromonospora echinospora]|uniref:Probable allantoicase n=1 Tax=Micromonospora echinospora TaxID=1877 RepID=A0A1C4ZJH4_MICEC|nr:allantoicase [Micromonospora echinospora]OZV81561.1 allantoicase [Micromonospora echinospora]SCF33173.1 allantoicase [Micromonospora echinospora]